MAQTPTKRIQSSEWVVPPSPRSLEVMYRNIREQHVVLKDEVKELLKRLLAVFRQQSIRKVLLDDYPLVNVYDHFLDVAQCLNEEVARRDVPVVVITDSSSSEI